MVWTNLSNPPTLPKFCQGVTIQDDFIKLILDVGYMYGCALQVHSWPPHGMVPLYLCSCSFDPLVEFKDVKIASNHGLTNDLVFLSSSSGWAGGHAPGE